MNMANSRTNDIIKVLTDQRNEALNQVAVLKAALLDRERTAAAQAKRINEPEEQSSVVPSGRVALKGNT